MTTLKLVTTENFGELPCNIYQDINNDIFLTREQIGKAFEYSNPDVALSKIHKKHKDRLDQLSVVTKLVSTDGKSYNTILYTERGIMEICRWSRQAKANQFMDWVWNIVEAYRNGHLNSSSNQSKIDEELVEAISTLTQTINTMQQDISFLKESTQKKKLPEKKYSRWKTNTFKKLNALTKYANENSDQSLQLNNTIHITINEMEDTYSIAYKSEFDMEPGAQPYVIDVINHYKEVKDMYTLILDSIIEKLGIKLEKEITSRNIFDELAMNLSA